MELWVRCSSLLRLIYALHSSTACYPLPFSRIAPLKNTHILAHTHPHTHPHHAPRSNLHGGAVHGLRSRLLLRRLLLPAAGTCALAPAGCAGADPREVSDGRGDVHAGSARDGGMGGLGESECVRACVCARARVCVCACVPVCVYVFTNIGFFIQSAPGPSLLALTGMRLPGLLPALTLPLLPLLLLFAGPLLVLGLEFQTRCVDCRDLLFLFIYLVDDKIEDNKKKKKSWSCQEVKAARDHAISTMVTSCKRSSVDARVCVCVCVCVSIFCAGVGGSGVSQARCRDCRVHASRFVVSLICVCVCARACVCVSRPQPRLCRWERLSAAHLASLLGGPSAE